MTEAEWLDETNRLHLFSFQELLKQEHRRLLLFGCACCRRVWHLVQMDAARRIVALAEARADGKATEADLQAAYVDPDFTDFYDRMTRATETRPQLSKLTHNVIEAARWLAHTPFTLTSAVAIAQGVSGNPEADFFWRAGLLGGTDVTPDDREEAEQDKVLRDIFGNPFRPVAFNPAWRTDTAIALAAQMYEARDFTAMPILADALQDAGCNNDDVLNHCRDAKHAHVRGCWACDLVLGLS